MSQDIVTSRLRLTSIEVSDTHVSFEIGSGGFSPFALVWDTDEGTGGGGGGGAIQKKAHEKLNSQPTSNIESIRGR